MSAIQSGSLSEGVRVVKVGGSLLDWPRLPQALQGWLAQQPAAKTVLLCGGGPLADTIRQADRQFNLGEETSHALCLEVLGVTARLLAALLPGAVVAWTYDALLRRLAEPQSAAIVFDPRGMQTLRDTDLAGLPLPASWEVTSDSIAASLAIQLEADELVLLKSADPPPAATHRDLAARGYVDRYFPVAAAGVRYLRLVNLRRVTEAPVPAAASPRRRRKR